MESEALVDKCENLARADVNDLFFSDPYNLVKSNTAFKKQLRQLTTNYYRAQVVILNGLLVENIGTILSGNSLKNVEDYLSQFDRLVARSSTLSKTADLEEVQKYAKSLLYYRLGDYLLVSMKSKNTYDEQGFILALCAYAIALDHLRKGSLSSVVAMESAEILNIVELYMLLKNNMDLLNDVSKFQAAMNDDKLGRKLVSYFSESIPTSKTYSFIISDASHRIQANYELPVLILDVLLPKVWALRHSFNFFERLLWLVSKASNNGTLNFLDESVRKLKAYPDDLRILGHESFSLLDLKVALYRISKYVYFESPGITRLESISYPYLAFMKPTSIQKKFWDSCLALIEGSLAISDMLSKVKLMNALEEIRLRKENYDTTVLFSTFRWLRSISDANKTQGQSIILELTERYAHAALNSLSHRIASSKAGDTIFSSSSIRFTTTVFEDDIIAEEIGIYLAERSMNRKEFREAETYLLNIPVTAQDSENIREFLYKLYCKWSDDTENSNQKDHLNRLAARQKDNSFHRLSDLNSSFLSDMSYKSALDHSNLDETEPANGHLSSSSYTTPGRSQQEHANETTPSSATSENLRRNRSARELAKTREKEELMRVLVNGIYQSRQLIRDFSLFFPELGDKDVKLSFPNNSFKREPNDNTNGDRKVFKMSVIKKEALETSKESHPRIHDHFCCGTDSEQEEVLRILDNRANLTDF